MCTNICIFFLSFHRHIRPPLVFRSEWKYFLLFRCRIKDNGQDADERLIDLLNLVTMYTGGIQALVLGTTASYAANNGILLLEYYSPPLN